MKENEREKQFFFEHRELVLHALMYGNMGENDFDSLVSEALKADDSFKEEARKHLPSVS